MSGARRKRSNHVGGFRVTDLQHQHHICRDMGLEIPPITDPGAEREWLGHCSLWEVHSSLPSDTGNQGVQCKYIIVGHTNHLL